MLEHQQSNLLQLQCLRCNFIALAGYVQCNFSPHWLAAITTRFSYISNPTLSYRSNLKKYIVFMRNKFIKNIFFFIFGNVIENRLNKHFF
jgi:hypothetical protein